MVLEYPSETYTKCVTTPRSNGWAHMTLNTMHLPPDYGVWAWICNNLIYLGWFKFKVYGTIIMAQGQYNGVGTFIWDLYQVCYNTREQ